MNNYKKQNRVMYLTAFFVPVILVSILYICSKVFPFGEECFMKTDMYHQYVPFMAELRHKLVNGESLLYSWDVGLGSNFSAIYAYYLASPLNFLVVLVSQKYVIEFMMVLTIVKIGLASLAETFYLANHRMDRRDIGPAAFGILYGLSGYMCAYYWNTMWLDCIVLLPLVILGAERLIRRGDFFLYTLTLGLCIFSNYYISIMVCIFLVLYFIYANVVWLPVSRKDFLMRCLRFAFCSLIAGLLAGVVLLPAYYGLEGTASAGSTFPKTVKSYFSVVEMLARMQPAVQTEQVLEHWPNIYAGAFLFLLFPLFLFAKRISLREKCAVIILALVLLASFSINTLDYLWHGMHFPNSLPCRQSFCFVFIALYMGYRAYENKDGFTKKQLAVSLVAAACFILFAQKDADTKYYDWYVTWLTLGLVFGYALVLYLYKNKLVVRSAAFAVAMLLVLAEVTINAAVTSFSTCSRTYYTKDNEDIRTLIEEKTGTDNPSEVSPWRYERVTRRTKNDGAWLNYPTLSIFSSTAPAAMTKLMTKLGCEASTNAYSITGSTPLVDMLFGVRYGFFDAEQPDAQGKKLLGSSGSTWLYEKDYSLPIGWVLPSAMTSEGAFERDKPYTLQNAFCDSLGVPHVLVEDPKTGTTNGTHYNVTIAEDGEYYAYVTNSAVKSVTVDIEGSSKTVDHVDRKFFVELGDLKADQLVRITSKTEDKNMEVKLFRVDYYALEELYEKLNSQSLQLTGISSGKLEGTLTVDPKAAHYVGDSAVLALTIPYDKGWSAWVDGEKAEPVPVMGQALLGLELSAGQHTVKLSYVPKGLKLGIFLSVLGLLGLIFCFAMDRTKQANELEEKLQQLREGKRIRRRSAWTGEEETEAVDAEEAEENSPEENAIEDSEAEDEEDDEDNSSTEGPLEEDAAEDSEAADEKGAAEDSEEDLRQKGFEEERTEDINDFDAPDVTRILKNRIQQ